MDDGWDVRCPEDSRTLLFRLQEGLVEVACRGCRAKERQTDPAVLLVLHRYDATSGVLVDTRVLRPL